MKRFRFKLGALLLALTASFTTLALANPIEQLQASGHLRIDSSLTPDSGIVPGQKVRLTLEIATDSWFAGGTRIGIPEVPGLVILQTEQFASNSSETRNGQPWVIQRWTLDIFPQRPGDFFIPPISLQLKVSAGDIGEVEGELYSPSSQFNAVVPRSLAQAKQWVAAPAFAISQNFDRALDNLEVGDAFEQEILFEASDVMAMMLPTYEPERQPGLAAYPLPPILDNNANRGKTLASRTVRINYVVEQPGKYLLPQRDYFWWNTASAELELLSLPEIRFHVAGVAAATENAGTTAAISPRQLLILIVGLAALAAMLRFAWVYLPRLPGGAAAISELISRLKALRNPALARHLNPGSNAEE